MVVEVGRSIYLKMNQTVDIQGDLKCYESAVKL